MGPTQRPIKDFTNISGMRAALYVRVSQFRGNGDDEPAADEHSVEDQEREGRAWADRVCVDIVQTFTDRGLSASTYRTKERQGFDDLLDFVKTDDVDIVWVWAIDRSNRDLEVFAKFRNVFIKHQVAVSVNGRITDPNDYDGWMLLGITSQFSERFSHELSKNVRRGMESIALAGRPAGQNLYGYRRTYDPITRKLERVEPNYLTEDGDAADKSPAAIVREVFRRVAAGDGLNTIAQDLNDRGIPTRQSAKRWYPTDIRDLAINPSYIARRTHHVHRFPQIEKHKAILDGVEAIWPPLVDEDTFWAVHRILTDPARKTTRPSAGKSLLAFVATCGKCGSPLQVRKRRRQRPQYACRYRGCTGIAQEKLNDYVEEVMIRWLSDPAVFAELTKVDDSAAAAQARADANRAHVQLEEWRRLADRGDADPVTVARAAKGLLVQIDDAERRAQGATLPPALVGRIGPEAEAAWNLADDGVKRQMIQAVADIAVNPSGRGRRDMPTDQRVEWRWLIGPDAD